jgi:D-beta-D-heptose 7-phosphate kinase/D-beta-D-heptose 1-phosphate adenosyltransferase
MTTNLPDFAAARVLVIGDIMLDRYWHGDTSRISPEAPVPVVRVGQAEERPGGAANVALNITALGGKV